MTKKYFKYLNTGSNFKTRSIQYNKENYIKNSINTFKYEKKLKSQLISIYSILLGGFYLKKLNMQ